MAGGTRARKPPVDTIQSRSRGAIAATILRLLAIVASLSLFTYTYEWSQPQVFAPCLWVAAILILAWELRARFGSLAAGLRPAQRDVAIVAGLLALFALCWLPFYDNWRWAYTGDSLSFFGLGHHLHGHGLRQNPLSVRGVDNFYTYLWELSYNAWMLVLGPGFFAHRFGLFFMGSLALVSTYALYGLLLGRSWAVAIVVATATNYVWLWMSYVSYLRMDGILLFNLMLMWAVLVSRNPDRFGLYFLCGLTAGISVFYTPATWGAVGLAAAFVGVTAVRARVPQAAIILIATAIVAALPALLEVPWFLEMFRNQSRVAGDPQGTSWTYVARIYREILLSPYDSPIDRLGAQGAFLRAPLGTSYVLGCILAALALVPPIARSMRIPPTAGVLLLLLLANALLFALTNKGYAHFSHKRTYVLIPLQVYFAILPFFVAATWGRTRRHWQRGIALALIASIAFYIARNLELIARPAPYTYGTNAFDGLIELRQRHSELPVLLLTSRSTIRDALAPHEMLHIAYKLRDTLEVEEAFEEATIEPICRSRGVICYEPNFDQERIDQLLAPRRDRIEAFPLLNSVELRCVRCNG